MQTELQSLDTQVTELEDQQQKLIDSEQKLRAKIEAFRTKKEVIKAQYSAAEAQVRISEAATGVGEQMADVGLAMQRAVDKTENMKARATPSRARSGGDVRDITALGSGEDDIDRQLKQLSASSAVDDELAKLKAEVGAGPRRERARSPRQVAQSAAEAAPQARPRVARDDRPHLRRGPVPPRGPSTEGSTNSTTTVVAAVEAGDEERFHGSYGELLEFVRTHGTALAEDELEGSDLILPPSDISLAEAESEFTGVGLIPD